LAEGAKTSPLVPLLKRRGEGKVIVPLLKRRGEGKVIVPLLVRRGGQEEMKDPLP